MPAAPHGDRVARAGDRRDARDGGVGARRAHDEVRRVRRGACDVVTVVGALRRVADDVGRAGQSGEARREAVAHSPAAAMIASA